MSHREEIRQLLPAYVLGALDADERRRVDDYLEAADGELDGELFELTRQLEILADELPPVRPSEVTRGRLLRRIGHEERPAAGSWLPWAAAAALFLVAATLGWQNFTQRRLIADLVERESLLESRLAGLRDELAATRQAAARLAAAQRVVAAPEATRVLLAGLEDAPGASAHLYLDPRARRAVLYAADLPPLAADRTYQLWFIGDQGPVSGGTFDADPRGEATLVVDEVTAPEEIALWAVTIEPAGGVPQPTGPMVLKS